MTFRPFTFRRGECAGTETVGKQYPSRLVLERLDVPSSAIRPLGRTAIHTVQELEVTAAELRRTGGRRVILNTSKAHSFRVRATFRAQFTDLDARVRYAPGDAYNPTGSWRHTPEALDVSREVFGLLNVVIAGLLRYTPRRHLTTPACG